jgi:hypothetical protein
MKKSEFIAKLEVVKDHSPVVSIDFVLAGLGMLEDETPERTTLSREMIEDISNRIELCLDHNNEDLVDKDQVTFDISYGNQLEVEDVYVDVYKIMQHVTAILEEYESDDEIDSNSNGDESGLVQSAMREFNELSNR